MAMVVVNDDSNGGLVPTSMEPELSNIQPIPIRKTLMIVNHFVVHTTQFVNRFAALCEDKLVKVSQGVQRLEITLAILEAKLKSIDWLEPSAADSNSVMDAVPTTFDSSGAPAVAEGSLPMNGDDDDAKEDKEGGGGGGGGVEAEAEVAAANILSVSEDPIYAKYFRMLRMGVPKDVLRQKMIHEGVDGNVIDLDPSAPSPGGTSTALVVVGDPSEDEDDDETSDISV